MRTHPLREAAMAPKKASPTGPAPHVDDVVATLRGLATPKTLDGMARYAIPSDNAFGVAVGDMRDLAKRLGRHHDLAEALWQTGFYEARMMSAFVDDPKQVTPEQMDRWMADVSDWAVCDTLCFHLFDRTPHAFGRIEAWADRPEEFVKRGAFALLASVALHDKKAKDEPFLRALPWVERAATDDRNFVKKGVSWALRGVGKRGGELRVAAIEVATRLSASPEKAARWVGNDALREFRKKAG